MKRTTQGVVLFGISLVFIMSPVFVFAGSFTATPLVIDAKGKPREIMKFSVTLENSENHLITIYPWVTNYTSASGSEMMPDLSRADLTSSLANWIEMTRGVVDLIPGESRTIPILVQINLNAKPGVYHAELRFSQGPDRATAEMNTKSTLAVPINIEVLDDANEKLQLATFIPDKDWFTGAKASFSYKLENIGNRGLIPKGKIRIYDRRGAEVASVDANMTAERLEPSMNSMLAATWEAEGEFGKYKAMLDLEYGEGGRGTIQDTVFFWVVPWQRVLGMFISITVASVIIAILLHSRTHAGLAYARTGTKKKRRGVVDSEDGEGGDMENPIGYDQPFVELQASAEKEVTPQATIMPRAKAREPASLVLGDVNHAREVSPSYSTTMSANPRHEVPRGAVRLSAPAREQHDPEHILNLKQ